MKKIIPSCLLFILTFPLLASTACFDLSGAEFMCQKLDGLMKISYEAKNSRVAFISIDEDVQVASWYSTKSLRPIVLDVGDGLTMTTPEIIGKATCSKEAVKFETFNTLDKEKTTQLYTMTTDGMIITDVEEGKSIACKRI